MRQNKENRADAVKSALTDSDLMVFIKPFEGTIGRNNALFELGVAGALKKPVVAVVKSPSDVLDMRAAPWDAKAIPMVSAGDLTGLINQVQAVLKY